MLRPFVQLIPLITLVLQLTDLRLVKGLGGRGVRGRKQPEFQLISYDGLRRSPIQTEVTELDLFASLRRGAQKVKLMVRFTVKYCSASSWSFSSFSWPPASCFSLEEDQQPVNHCSRPTTRAKAHSSSSTPRMRLPTTICPTAHLHI